MKLFISQVGSDAKNQELTIRNPNAAVANLRAGIAITMKIDSRSFIMSFKGKDLDDETKKLQGDGDDALGLKDGDTVTISVRRPRDSTTSTTSAVDNKTTVQKSSKTSARNSRASTTTTANNDVAQNMLAAANLDLNDKSKIDDASHPDEDEEEFDEEAEWLTEDEEGDEESEFDEEAEKEAEEVQKMFVLLSELPNKEEMRQRFKTDPEGTLRTLQTEKPELFELINKHPQAFLTMANEEDDDELEGEWIGGDEMNPDDAEFMRFLVGNGEDYEGDGDDDAEDDFAQLADLIAQGRADNLHDSDDTDDEEGNNNNEDSAAGRGSGRRTRRRRAGGVGRRATGGPSSTNTRRQQTEAAQEASLTDADNEKIMRIVELGFSREHAVRAYLRFGKNPDRAAAWLFENPPE